MNAPTAQAKQSLVVTMAQKYSMDPGVFYATIKASIMINAPHASDEQIAVFLMVAHEYNLSPILKQIHCFPSKSGGITPIISIDGWCAIVNRQPEYDGCDFQDHLDDDGKVYAITCSMWRKDRSRASPVTEYMIENQRNTDVWRTAPYRMLRHRAFIQAARITFGLSAAFDEGHHLVEVGNGETVDVNLEPMQRQVAPPPRKGPPPAPNGKTMEKRVQEQRAKQDPDLYGKAPAHDPETGEIFDPEDFLTELDGALHTAKTPEDLATVYADHDVSTTLVGHAEAMTRAADLLRWHAERIKKAS